ncbi:manganese efflux pump, partial [Akkermansia muciniphila]|uniref:manganese efflux pump n=1 Tax=Akkermansia muciniphila TaxID=239935 RepID=UPI0012543820
MQFHLLSSLLFGLSSNTDNLAVGLSYGIKKIPIHWRHNLLVALITFSGTILSMIFGKSVLLFLPKRFAGLLGSLIIIAIGGTGLIRYLVKKTAKSPDTACTELRALTTREALLLGFALTVNN